MKKRKRNIENVSFDLAYVLRWLDLIVYVLYKTKRQTAIFYVQKDGHLTCKHTVKLQIGK